MGFDEHIQLGRILLEKKDSVSMKEALNHFKTANELADESGMEKPQTLYYLALGNYWIGNIVLSYKLANKAIKCIDTAMNNSTIYFDEMRNVLGENQLNDLIKNLKGQFPKVTNSIATDDFDFNENELDFSLVDKMYSSPNINNLKKSSSINSLSKQLDTANELDEYVLKTFTKNQKRAVIFSLILLAQSDGEFHKNEDLFLNQTANLLDYDFYEDETFREFQSLGADNLFEILNTLDLKQKDWYIITVFTMANADFKTTTEENHFMKVFFEKMDITSETLDKCLSKLG